MITDEVHGVRALGALIAAITGADRLERSTRPRWKRSNGASASAARPFCCSTPTA